MKRLTIGLLLLLLAAALTACGGSSNAPAPTTASSPGAVTPQAAPPTTRKIEVTYQGFYETADGPKHAVCKVGEAFIASAVGAKVTANLFIADVALQSLTLTNTTAQTNILTLNVKKEIVVPLP